MIVCVCNRLNEARIRAACASRPGRVEDVYALCGTKRNCGRCQETIAGMLEDAKAADARLVSAA